MKIRYIALPLIAASFSTAAQEQLTKEIDVEREIVPELRAATRLDVFPTTVRPDIKPVRLSPGEHTEAAEYQPLTLRYEPAWGGFAATPTPYRGYVGAGYFPTSDFGLAAGFAAVAKKDMGLGIWANLNRRQWKDEYEATYPREDYKTFDIAVGADFITRFRAGNLSVRTTFEYSAFNKGMTRLIPNESSQNPTSEDIFSYDDPTQKVTRWNLQAGWDGHASNDLEYGASLQGGLFHFGKAGSGDYRWNFLDREQADRISPVHQTAFGAGFGASLPAGAQGRAGVGISSQWLAFNHFPFERNENYADASDESYTSFIDAKGKTVSVTSLTPYYRFDNGSFSAKIGVKADITTGSGKTFHIAPDVMLGYNPASSFGAWIHVTGGEHLNSLESLYAVSRYISPLYAYTPSNMPVAGEIGFRVGPFKGIALEAGGTYANAHNWLMPDLMNSGYNSFKGVNLHSFKIFGSITAAWRDIISLRARYDYRFGNDTDNLWYAWRDGAKSVVSASLTVRPIDKLSANAAFEARYDRNMQQIEYLPAGETKAQKSLGTFASLSAGANYRITAPLSIFVRFDNILNRKDNMIFGLHTPGFNGLFGVDFKF